MNEVHIEDGARVIVENGKAAPGAEFAFVAGGFRISYELEDGTQRGWVGSWFPICASVVLSDD